MIDCVSGDSGKWSRMFGLGIASGVEHRFMVKEECNLQMGHIVRVGRGTHIYMAMTLLYA